MPATTTAAQRPAGAFDYKVPGYNLNTYAINDDAGDLWYYTDSGNWRRQRDRYLQPNMPTMAAASTPETPAFSFTQRIDPNYQLKNPNWFHRRQAETEATQTQISPYEMLAHGEDMGIYNQLYGPSAWWTAEGKRTALAPEGLEEWDLSDPAVREQIQAAQNTNDENLARMFPTLFGNELQWLPENYQGSPMYQWQKQQGQKELNNLLSARGLVGSGAELETNAQLQAALNASEADRISDLLEAEGGRFQTLLQNAANSSERQGDEGWNRLMGILNFLGTTSPMSSAYGAASQSGSNAISIAQALANLGLSAASAGGPEVLPTGENTSGISMLNNLFGNQNNLTTGNLITSMLGTLFNR